MRYVIFILVSVLSMGLSAQMVTQPGTRDYQITGGTLPDSILYILGTDTLDGSSKQGLGKWYRGDTLFNALGDHDFYGLGTGRPAFANEDSIETADTMYILLHGLKGGLHSKIEFLKESKIRFDWPEEGDGSVFDYLTVKPVQQSQDNTNWNEGVFTASGAGDRWNNVHYEGWNLLGGAREDASSTAVGLFIEDHYDLNTDNIKSEIIFAFIDSSGTQWRPFWMNIDKKYREDWTAIFTNVATSFTSSINGQPYIQLNTSADTVSSIIRMTSPKSNDTKGVEFEWNQGTNQLGLTPFGTSNSTFNITLPYTTTVALRRTSDTRVDNGLTMTDLAATSAGGYFGTALIDGTLDFNSSTLSVDTSIIATQYDLTTVGGTDTDDQNLTIEGAGPTYDIAINDGTDVTISGAGIITLSESPANTLVITGTEVDGSTTNELFEIEENNSSEGTDMLRLDFLNPFDVAVVGAEADISLDLDEITTDATPEGDEYVVGSDGSTVNEKWAITNFDLSSTNEAWTADADDATTPVVVSNQTLAFRGNRGIDTDLIDGATDSISLVVDGSEWDAVSNYETDDYMQMYDSGNGRLERISQANYITELESLLTVSGDGNGIYDGDGTVPVNTDIQLTDGNTRMYGTAAALKIEDTNGSGSPTLTLEGNVEDADAPMGSVVFSYTDSDYATDQSAWTIIGQRETDSQEHSTLEITANEATSSPPVVTWEENENLSDNTQETSARFNSGIAYTQFYESTAAGAITLDRGYYTVSLGSGHSGNVNLPEIYGVDESNIEIDAAQVPIGQEFVICNYTGGNITLAAFNGTSTNDDYLNSVLAGTITMTTDKCYILKAVRINGSNQGYWKYWISD